MSDLNDLFKVIAEGKKAAIEKSPGKKLLNTLKEDLHTVNPFLVEPKAKQAQEVLIEAKPVIPEVKPAAKMHSPEEVAKALSVDATFQQPNPDPVQLEFKAVQSKLKFLEQAIGKIAATGPGSGEVRLHRLDDVKFNNLTNSQLIKYDSNTKRWINSNNLTSLTIGNVESGNYSEFTSDGAYIAKGNATCFRDELHDLIKSASNNPGSSLVYDFVESTLVFKTSAVITDYAVMNVQINHDWKLGTQIEPHIHWFQTENNTPNWLIQYRWQANSEQKTNTWINVKYSQNTFAYTSGTLNQITAFTPIIPPANSNLSDIIQFRIMRDTTNVSGLFTGADTYSTNAAGTSFDIHIEIDMLGSNSRYAK